MEALIDLIKAIAAFVIDVTIHALVFIFHLLMAAFSPHYRQKLREDWNTSNLNRFSIILGVSLYSIALAIALFVWIPILGNQDEPETNDSPISNQFTQDEIKQMKGTKEIGELVDVAGDIIKQKLEKQEQEDSEKR